MDTQDISSSFVRLFSELVEGAQASFNYVLNGGDAGLLRSLDRLSAADASKSSAGGATIAAHVEHLRFGLSLMNRWAAGETDPWSDADWRAAWQTTAVSEEQWQSLRESLAMECRHWLDALGRPRDVSTPELRGVLGSIVHLAYHLGAIRQIDRSARGPTAND